MKTSEKLIRAFEEFRPHLTGHETAMDLFLEALYEVEKMEVESKQYNCRCENRERCYGAYFPCVECRKEKDRLHAEKMQQQAD